MFHFSPLRFRLILLFAISSLIVKCDTLPTKPPSTPQTGVFSISRLTALGKVSATNTDSSTGIFIDTLSNTSSCYFSLRNIGTAMIFGVHLSNTNPACAFEPNTLAYLNPIALMDAPTIIKLTVTHGTANSGIGTAAVLAAGTHFDTLLITGSTANLSDTSELVSLQANLSMFVRIADVTVRRGANQIDLSRPTYSGVGFYPGMHNVSAVPSYNVGTDTVYIQNTGNVPVELAWWPSTNTAAHSLHLPVDSIVALPRPCSAIEIDTKNVIADPLKFFQGSNGYIQMLF